MRREIAMTVEHVTGGSEREARACAEQRLDLRREIQRPTFVRESSLGYDCCNYLSSGGRPGGRAG